MTISPGFQVRHSEVMVSAHIFAQSLSGLFSKQHCQLRQTVSDLNDEETDRHTSYGQTVYIFFEPVEIISLGLISISIT